jgi:putative SOS response-associated peptidase YedK
MCGRYTATFDKREWVTLEGVRLFAFAGLWCVENNGEASFVIITTEASPALQNLHARMPVILPASEQHAMWLRAPLGDALAMLQPYTGSINVRRVSPLVNSASNDDLRCLEEDAESFQGPVKVENN